MLDSKGMKGSRILPTSTLIVTSTTMPPASRSSISETLTPVIVISTSSSPRIDDGAWIVGDESNVNSMNI